MFDLIRSRVLFAVAIAISLSVVSLFSSQAPQDGPKFRSGVTLVEVSAVVSRHGVPVVDLTEDEVAVFDEGNRQPLVSFEFVDLTTPEGLTQGRDFVLLIDNRHISPRLTKATRDVSLSFVRSLTPHDRLAVVNTGSRELVQQLSTDRAVSERLISTVRGERIGLLRAMQFESDALTTLEVLRRVAEVLAREGTAERRAVVLVSEGPRVLPENVGGGDTPILREAYRRVLRDTSAANVAVYAIDPRGLEAGGGSIRIVRSPLRDGLPSQVGQTPSAQEPPSPSVAEASAAGMAGRHMGTLGQLSRFTGGVLTVDSNDLVRHLPLVLRDSRQHYRLVYAQPERRPEEPRHAVRRIRVTVSRPDVEVRARQLYVPR